MDNKLFDLVIIGTGPAGYTASIYASRYKLSNLVIGKLMGGLIAESAKVCNFPTEDEIPGLELMAKMQKHATGLGGREVFDEVAEIKKDDKGLFHLKTRQHGVYFAKSIILATGLKHRQLNVPGEAEFSGRGVAYCATCDGFFYRNKTVAVIGGNDSAISAGVYLSDIASRVYLIYRKGELRGEPAWVELLEKKENVRIIYNTNVLAIKGDQKIRSLVLDKPYQGKYDLELDGMFIEIGAEPNRLLIDQINVATDEAGYILVGPNQSTNILGLFAAGDITTSSNKFKQVITACSEGAIAAESVYKFLSKSRSKVEAALPQYEPINSLGEAQ